MRFRSLRGLALAAAAVVSVPLIGLAAPTARAAPTGSPAYQAAAAAPADKGDYTGRVIAPVAVRTYFTTAASRIGTLNKGAKVSIWCKANSVPVDGNPRWYMLSLDARHWVSARYVTNVGAAPQWCLGHGPRGKVIASPNVTVRTAPTTKAASAGRLPYGKIVKIVCKVNGPAVDGNPRWYQLFDGRWVTARYVMNVKDPLFNLPVACG
ncbi:SH3 domain-containing protein [Actinopolymorpha pittospori]|uniref:SH3b domain-containing protein n=1 Tax=Actinopolymorpha pittospori TaxID=648752 RepID=A0A927MS89_9ACTN|nr:SH3 domain-containing protein [Actinopolymorpha pittospori]MBE1605931.1 hypothetical protein [Actinopolymorpha pittospori]